jgi:ABC-type cobalamin/Fe3+-siderophores transport system ATPase subunit
MAAGVVVENLAFSYSGHVDDEVFRDVTFSVGKGDVFCLLGPNGTGKSTLLKCICNVLRPQKGKILLNGKDISQLKASEAAKEVGYVPQSQVSTFPFLVRDIVVMGRAPHLSLLASPSDEDVDIAHSAMEAVGILGIAERPCTQLSGGEWQLTLIARALAQEPRTLVLDEPTSHLDIGNQMRILKVVKGLAETGLVIIMATHIPDHAFILAKQVAILNHGRIQYMGSPEGVITDENMRATYGVEVRVVHVAEGVDRKACFPALGKGG